MVCFCIQQSTASYGVILTSVHIRTNSFALYIFAVRKKEAKGSIAGSKPEEEGEEDST